MTRKIAGDYAAVSISANGIAPSQIETPLADISTPEALAEAVNGTVIDFSG